MGEIVTFEDGIYIDNFLILTSELENTDEEQDKEGG